MSEERYASTTNRNVVSKPPTSLGHVIDISAYCPVCSPPYATYQPAFPGPPLNGFLHPLPENSLPAGHETSSSTSRPDLLRPSPTTTATGNGNVVCCGEDVDRQLEDTINYCSRVDRTRTAAAGDVDVGTASIMSTDCLCTPPRRGEVLSSGDSRAETESTGLKTG